MNVKFSIFVECGKLLCTELRLVKPYVLRLAIAVSNVSTFDAAIVGTYGYNLTGEFARIQPYTYFP